MTHAFAALPLCLQGGDPTGTGKGGKSIYQTPNGKFPDEIADHLKHNKVMAAAGFLSSLSPCGGLTGDVAAA